MNVKIINYTTQNNNFRLKYAKSGDAGLDLVAVSIEETNKYIEYDTGVAVEIPNGCVGLAFPRSSISKYDLLQCNSVGVIDSGYRGTIRFRFKRLGPDIYQIGDKIGQLVILDIPSISLNIVTMLSDSERGTGGFGSSGQ